MYRAKTFIFLFQHFWFAYPSNDSLNCVLYFLMDRHWVSFYVLGISFHVYIIQIQIQFIRTLIHGRWQHFKVFWGVSCFLCLVSKCTHDVVIQVEQKSYAWHGKVPLGCFSCREIWTLLRIFIKMLRRIKSPSLSNPFLNLCFPKKL